MQKIFYNIIQDETKKQMLSSVGDEYVFTVVNPSMISEIKSEPRRSFICIMGTMLGAFISVLIVLLTWFLRKPS
jgi:hypothetical protein